MKGRQWPEEVIYLSAYLPDVYDTSFFRCEQFQSNVENRLTNEAIYIYM